MLKLLVGLWIIPVHTHLFIESLPMEDLMQHANIFNPFTVIMLAVIQTMRNNKKTKKFKD